MTTPVAGAHYPRWTGEFLSWFSTDDDCLDYLEWLRWPGGFVWPDCGIAGGWRLADGRVKCGGCGSRTSVTAGTIFDRTRTPLTVWFHACWLFATAKDGVSAQYLQRALEISSYQTAWAMLHRLRSALVRPGRGRLSGTVEVDETYIGGEEPGLRGGGQRGKKVLTGIAVEVPSRKASAAAGWRRSMTPAVTRWPRSSGRTSSRGEGHHRRLGRVPGHQRPGISAPAHQPEGGPRSWRGPGRPAARSPPRRLAVQAGTDGRHQARLTPRTARLCRRVVFRFNRAAVPAAAWCLPGPGARRRPRAIRYADLLASEKPRREKRARGGTGHPPSLERPAADRPWRTAEMQLQLPVRLSGYPRHPL